MIRNLVLVLSVLFLVKNGGTQSFVDYKNITNIGSLPEEYKYSGNDSYKKSVKDASNNQDVKIKLRDKKEFLLESNFAITDLLRSGVILFNSPLNAYVNKVTDKVLESNAKLSKEIKVYIVQSTAVNAFTFNDGKVFINMGLLAHLKNEAQLAFIIAHEVSHYSKGHSLNIFVERKKINKGVNEYEDFDEAAKLFATNNFSREQELDADADGLRLYAKTGYDLQEAKNALDLLHYADQAFENTLFPRTYFDRPYMVMPKVLLGDSVELTKYDEIDLTGEEEDEKKDVNGTHPTISKRIRTLDKINLGKDEKEGGSKYLVSEKDFLYFRNVACFELCRLFNLNYRPLENLLHISILEKEFPNNRYLQEIKLRALYQIVNAVNKGYRNSIISKPEKLEGEVQKIHQLFYSLTKEEVSALCLRLAWEIKVNNKLTKEDEVEVFVKNIVFSYANNISAKFGYFKTAKDYNDSLIQSWYKPVENVEKKTGKNRSKFAKAKRRKGSFASFVMIPYLSSNEFKDYYLEVSSEINEKTKEDEDKETELEKTKASIKITKNKNLGVKDLVFLDPSYFVIDQRKKQANRYIESEEKEKAFKNTILKCTNAANINASFIVPSEIVNSEEYNEYVQIKARMIECFNNEDLKPLPTDVTAINSFAKKYNTNYVATLINIAITDKKDAGEILMDFCYSVITYGCYLPVFIYHLTSPEKSNALVVAVYDIKSGEIKFGNIIYSEEDDNKDLISSELYNILIKLK